MNKLTYKASAVTISSEEYVAMQNEIASLREQLSNVNPITSVNTDDQKEKRTERLFELYKVINSLGDLAPSVAFEIAKAKLLAFEEREKEIL